MKQISLKKTVGLAALIFLLPTLAMAYGGHRGNGFGWAGRPGCEYGENEWRGGDRQYRHEMRAELLSLTDEQQEQIEAIRTAEIAGLTDEQQEQIEAIRTAEIAAHRDLREKMLEYREQMREITNKGTFDESAVRVIAEEKAKIQVEMAVARAEMRSKIHAIMTPEQQELAKNFSSERHNRWGRHHRGPGRGWQPDFD
jgi:Spy/CpxP family protein refolding chaperone